MHLKLTHHKSDETQNAHTHTSRKLKKKVKICSNSTDTLNTRYTVLHLHTSNEI